MCLFQIRGFQQCDDWIHNCVNTFSLCLKCDVMWHDVRLVSHDLKNKHETVGSSWQSVLKFQTHFNDHSLQRAIKLYSFPCCLLVGQSVHVSVIMCMVNISVMMYNQISYFLSRIFQLSYVSLPDCYLLHFSNFTFKRVKSTA